MSTKKTAETSTLSGQDDLSNSQRGVKALLVEDCDTMRKAVSGILEDMQLQVQTAANGMEALSVLDRSPVDVIFTDLVMPEMDGYELCEEIRRRPTIRHIPIIVTSTHRDAAYVVRALRMGADDYLTKPFDAGLAERVLERVFSNV